MAFAEVDVHPSTLADPPASTRTKSGQDTDTSDASVARDKFHIYSVCAASLNSPTEGSTCMNTWVSTYVRQGGEPHPLVISTGPTTSP